MHICSYGFKVKLNRWHVRGHHAEAGNELVDELARRALEEGPLLDLSDWFALLCDCRWIADLEWAWALLDEHFAPLIHDQALHFAVRPDSCIFQGAP